VHGEDAHLRRNVPSFFRLKPGLEHADDCQFSVAGAVQLLLRQAQAVDEGEISPFAENGASLSFRLNIPVMLARRRVNTKANSKKPQVGEIITTLMRAGHLDNYCRSAVGLAKIWNAVETGDDHKYLVDNVKMVAGGSAVRWRDFCFSLTRYGDLQKVLTRASSSIAAIVVINKISTNNDITTVSCVSATIDDSYPQTRFSPTLFTTPEIAATLEIGGQYIAFGRWRLGKFSVYTVPDTTHKINYQNAILGVDTPAQIARILVPTEGDD